MKILGFNMGHDVSYTILEDGIPIVHNELERFNRKKGSTGDGMKFMLDTCPKELYEDAKYAVHYKPASRYGGYPIDSFNKIKEIVLKNGGDFVQPGHHQSHAAAAFFSSEFDESLIITFDGQGDENPKYLKPETVNDGRSTFTTSFTIWKGVDNKIEELYIDPGVISWGVYWYRATGEIFKLGTGLSTDKSGMGFQGGTVMGMAALGSHEKYLKHFENILNKWMNNRPIDTAFLKAEAAKSEQNMFDIAASLQYMTEKTIKEQLDPYVKKYVEDGGKNICVSGGCALNCVMGGAMIDWYPEIENIYHDPIPYDGGLAIGSARYLYHHILDYPRIYGNPKLNTPYLGFEYRDEAVMDSIQAVKDKINTQKVTDDEVIELLAKDNNVISVFGGSSESGRRALGNRSILADPRSPKMKDIINEKVKHRQWFRPFAPSIIREAVGDWFEKDVDSPFMSFAIKWKKDVVDKVPAVVHFDGTARLQTVTEDKNEWYYNFIKKFGEKTGVPIVLNTSFNDREPIVETPDHALDCFLRTNIDYLYFRELNILVSKA